MESKHCLLPRLYSYPVIKAAYDQLVSTYSTGKESYPTVVGTPAGLAENSIKYALGIVEPLLHQIDGSLVIAEKAACQALDKVDDAYPVVKDSPDEILQELKAYYDTTSIKNKVDKTIAAKDYGLSVVHSGREYYTQRREALLKGMKGGVDETVVRLVGHVHGMIDMAEALLDRFTPGTSGGTTGSNGPKTGDSIYQRLSSIYGRLPELKDQAVTKYDVVKEHTFTIFQQLTDLSIILDYAKTQQDWAAETISSLKAETVNKITEARQGIARFSTKLQSIDDVSKQGYQFVFAQVNAVRDMLNSTIEFLSSKITYIMEPQDVRVVGDEAYGEASEPPSEASSPTSEEGTPPSSDDEDSGETS